MDGTAIFDPQIRRQMSLGTHSVRTKKLHGVKVKKVKKILGNVFYGGKTSFFRAKNFNVCTKTRSETMKPKLF